jgi:hypothetical protein
VKELIDTSGTFYARSILLVCVLVTLCISEGVGLQLLPIPTESGAPARLAEARLSEVCTHVPTPPLPSKKITVRIEIMAPKLKGLSHQSIQIIPSALLAAKHTAVASPCLLYSFGGPVSGYLGTFVSQATSRAPPLSA